MISMIPKTIHYFFDDVNFYRKGKKNTQLRMCYTSWRRACPDFSIRLWTPNNGEIREMINSSAFILKKYKDKDWAFVSDYVRAYVLYKYGGIYLDTDVEILKNLSPYLNNRFFCSIEGDILYGENIPEPAVMGSIAGHPLLKRIMDLYESDWIMSESNPIANVVAKKALKDLYSFEIISYSESVIHKLNKLYDKNVPNKICLNFELYKNQIVWQDRNKEVTIYPCEYFCPSWVSFQDKAFTDKTVAIHWNQSSWWKDSSQSNNIDNSKNLIRENEQLKYINNKLINENKELMGINKLLKSEKDNNIIKCKIKKIFNYLNSHESK